MSSSGQGNARGGLEKALELLAKRGWEVGQRETRGKGDAPRYAQEAAASGYEAVIVAGGDGTVNEVVSACGTGDHPKYGGRSLSKDTRR